MTAQGWNYEPLMQAGIGAVVAWAIYHLVQHELAERRARRVERARAKFRRPRDQA